MEYDGIVQDQHKDQMSIQGIGGRRFS